ncbi:hypothetical protein ACWAUC_11550 [Bradyrhizobium guangdongense]
MSLTTSGPERHPLWPWIVLITGLGALGLGAIFVLSWVMLALLGY